MSYIKRTNIKTVIFILLLLGILGYTYFQMQNLVSGPIITVSTPQDGEEFSSSIVEIVGTAKNISSISLNDRQIYINESGVFKEKFILSKGYNVVTVQAEDRFGIETKKVLMLVYN